MTTRNQANIPEYSSKSCLTIASAAAYINIIVSYGLIHNHRFSARKRNKKADDQL